MVKKTLAAMLVIGATGMVGTANANDLPHYGCSVFMCLANPNGPTDANYCKPYIAQLHEDLRDNLGMPGCEEAGTYAKQVYDPYDRCPEPLKPAGQQSYVIEGKRHPGGRPGVFDTVGQPQVSELHVGFGDFGERACVGKKVGAYPIGSYDEGYMVNVYDQVLWQKPQSPNVIDVYVNGQFSNRVHW